MNESSEVGHRPLQWRLRSTLPIHAMLTVVLWSAAVHAQKSAVEEQDSAGESENQPQSKQSPKVLEAYEPKPIGELLPNTSVERVSLKEVLSAARETAPAVERARARLLEGKARVEGSEVLTKYNPAVVAGVERFPFGEFSYGEAKAGVSQRFTTAGEQAARLESALQRRQVFQKRLARTRWAVHADVHRLYNFALVDLRQLRLNDRLRSFFEQTLEIAEMRYNAGDATKIAVQLARVELARARQELVRARSALVSRLRSLEKRAGLEAEALPVPSGSLPETRVDLDVERIKNLARESNPVVDVFEARRERAEAEYRYQKKKAWPDPKVGLFFKHKSPDGAPSESGLVAQLSVPIPVWNANKLGRLVSAKRRTVAETNLATLREKLGPRVADAVDSVRSAARQVDIYGKELVPAFERELKLLRRGYEAGQFDITDLTVAQERLLRGREQALKAMEDYFAAAARLERLTGEEFWNSSARPPDN